MSRLVIVSNRLPVTVSGQEDDVQLNASAGGLATALRCVHDEGDSLWAGYAGDTSKLSPAGHARLEQELTGRRLVSVPLSARDVALYYDGYSNTVLWPLFHYLLDKVRLDAGNEWRAYRSVNERFAAAIAPLLRPGDSVWVHDYHLTLLPGLLRKRCDDVRIGYFLHVPWPASDVYRILPQRREILESLLACDVVGFHTEHYRHNFIHSAAKVLGVDIGSESLTFEDRTVQVGVYPIGIDTTRFERESPVVDAAVQRIVTGTEGKWRMLGVDRLDYTKGVPRRLLAIDRLLEREPQLRNKLHFIQLAVPTREKVDAYAELRRTVNELVGRINSQYGSPTGVPVHLLYRSVSEDDLLALYRMADVMAVTPLRDGMNLVAKEYVASRQHDDGVLLLSEFTGAAAELDAALLVNPYDVGALADAMRRALIMPKEEQATRMNRLRARVRENSVEAWAKALLGDLSATTPVHVAASTPPAVLRDRCARFLGASPRALLLDYDGTLVPFAPLPDLARPDSALLALLAALSRLPDTSVHIVSGRKREDLQAWFGGTALHLHAEHGLWSRNPSGEWTARAEPPAFLADLVEVVQRHVRATPGAFLEPKSASVVFHFRNTEPILAEARLRALREELRRRFGERVDLLDGHKILEAKLPGVSKASVASAIAGATPRPTILAIGDDRTDEEMFRVLEQDDVSVHVGSGTSQARLRVPGPEAVRELLASLL